ncbi:MAG TPA: Mur ligase domain-containing protein, partial [Catalimonadaceae bacterium]|nr:Mur ligase domain-containing protein [Catalimonadaceae bacterium]
MPTFSQIFAAIDHSAFESSDSERSVFQLFYDSRLVRNGSNALFFALVSKGGDGHRFIPELVKRGVNQWIISDPNWVEWLVAQKGQNWILVPDSLKALQQVAAWHRSLFSIPILGITG